MANKFSLQALTERFPLGCEVVNLGSIHAVVDDYSVHADGTADLLLREIGRDGRPMRGRFTANPTLCEPAGFTVGHRDGLVIFG